MKSIPLTQKVNTDEQHTITETIDSFFVETFEHAKQTLGLRRNSRYKIISEDIRWRGNALGEDRVTYLLHKQTVLAGVLETRTEHNHVQYAFFRYYNPE